MYRVLCRRQTTDTVVSRRCRQWASDALHGPHVSCYVADKPLTQLQTKPLTRPLISYLRYQRHTGRCAVTTVLSRYCCQVHLYLHSRCVQSVNGQPSHSTCVEMLSDVLITWLVSVYTSLFSVFDILEQIILWRIFITLSNVSEKLAAGSDDTIVICTLGSVVISISLALIPNTVSAA